MGGHVCEQLHAGLWHMTQPAVTKCKHLTAARLLRYRRDEVLLDWGAGCGHGIAWLAAEAGVVGLAIDLMPKTVDWMLRRLPVAAAIAEASYRKAFRLLPDASVDHVISNAAVTNLRRKDQCALVRLEVLRVLRPGGTAWIGTWARGTV